MPNAEIRVTIGATRPRGAPSSRTSEQVPLLVNGRAETDVAGEITVDTLRLPALLVVDRASLRPVTLMRAGPTRRLFWEVDPTAYTEPGAPVARIAGGGGHE
jgi:hypothetical protein